MRRVLRSWWTRALVILLLLGLGGYWAVWQVLQSPWMAEQIRVRILTEIEKATGGRAELQRFALDWRLWRARVDGLVLHGTEPWDAFQFALPDAPPIRIPRVA